MAIMHCEDGMPVPRQGHWTYEAYAALPDDGSRYEILQGVLVMTPAPEPEHQRISKKIAVRFFEQVDARDRGEMFYAPIDVVLSEKDVFQPDVLVILNEHLDRVQKKRIVGAPDLVVEIISPSSVATDSIIKRTAYEQAGVPEYWLVDPQQKTIEVFALKNNRYISQGVFEGEQTISSRIVPDLMVPVARFFA